MRSVAGMLAGALLASCTAGDADCPGPGVALGQFEPSLAAAYCDALFRCTQFLLPGEDARTTRQQDMRGGR